MGKQLSSHNIGIPYEIRRFSITDDRVAVTHRLNTGDLKEFSTVIVCSNYE
jgi:hypothetical protein